MKLPRLLRVLCASVCCALLSACGDGKPGAFDKSGYHVDGAKVWYLENWTSKPFEVAGVDASTFQCPLPKDASETYARDRHRVYLRGRALAGVDPATFEILDGSYSRDASHVYRGETRICDDPAHFEVLSANFVKNSKVVYRLYPQVEVQTTDVASFRKLAENEGYSYFADRSQVYVNGNPIEGADPASFTVVQGGHGRDARRAYYFDSPLPEGTLLESYQVLTGQYSRDARRVYFMEWVMEGADPVTFEVTDAKFQRGKDARRTYEQGEPVPAVPNPAAHEPKS